MNPFRKFLPDLRTCELEDRLLPAIANVGVIVLTTGGYVLLVPSPGALAYPTGSQGGTSFSTMGFGGASSTQPGNINGIPGLAMIGTPGSSGGAGATINVSSGATDATNLNIPLVTRNTIANDALVPRPQIGRPAGDGSPILPPGEYYRWRRPGDRAGPAVVRIARRPGEPVPAPDTRRFDGESAAQCSAARSGRHHGRLHEGARESPAVTVSG